MPLQTYRYNNQTYYVDYRLQQFRSAVPFPKPIAFLDFRSPYGDRILTHMIRAGVADTSLLRL